MKKYFVLIALSMAAVFASCGDEKNVVKQEITFQYLLRATSDAKEQELEKSKQVQIEVGTKIDARYLKDKDLIPAISGYEFESISPAEVTVSDKKLTVKVYYKGPAKPDEKPEPGKNPRTANRSGHAERP